METVSSYFVFLVVIQRQTIEVSFRRHGLMESGIENSYLRNAGHQLGADIDTDQVCRL